MPEEKSLQTDIKRYLAIVLEKRYLALSIALVVVSVFTWSSFFLPKSYEASSTVFYKKSSTMDPLMKGMGISGSMEEILSSFQVTITSRDLVEKAVKKLDLKSMSPNQAGNLVQNIRKNLRVMVMGKGPDLFTISYGGSEPRMVRDIVNAIVSEYIEESVSSKRTDTYDAYEFIQSQLLEYSNRLDASDKTLREFRERNPRLIPQTETALVSRLEGFQTAMVEAEIKMKELMRKKDNLQKQLSGEKELTVAYVTREDGPQSRLNKLNNQLTLMTTKYTDSYPEVIKIKSEIDEVKKQIAQAENSKDSHTESSGSETAAINPIYQQLREEIAKTDAELESVKARSDELMRQQSEAQGRLGIIPKEQEEWSKLQRDRAVYQKIYDDLLVKLENARVSKDLDRTDKYETFKIVEPARLPSLPVKPDKVRMILFGIILGIASGIGAVFGIQYLTPTFQDADAVEAELKLPVFATISRVVTEADRLSEKRLDRKVFTAAGLYFSVILAVFAVELLSKYAGITLIHF
ncbi:MAG: XrtA system polysaccharide chain length determinant [Thermodesulfovibrionales bacterium]|jgi:polysaccharide chain length determinant protein (PEP-CTERM system associated)